MSPLIDEARRRQRRRRLALAVAAAVLAAAGGTLPWLHGKPSQQREVQSDGATYTFESAGGRLLLWRTGAGVLPKSFAETSVFRRGQLVRVVLHLKPAPY